MRACFYSWAVWCFGTHYTSRKYVRCDEAAGEMVHRGCVRARGRLLAGGSSSPDRKGFVVVQADTPDWRRIVSRLSYLDLLKLKRARNSTAARPISVSRSTVLSQMPHLRSLDPPAMPVAAARAHWPSPATNSCIPHHSHIHMRRMRRAVFSACTANSTAQHGEPCDGEIALSRTPISESHQNNPRHKESHQWSQRKARHTRSALAWSACQR